MSDKNYAYIKAGGQQLKVSTGEKITINRLEGQEGDAVTFSEVMLAGAEGSDSVKVGTPLLKGATVLAKIVGHTRGPKLLLYKKKRRKGYHKKQGHRQDLTELTIESINF